MLYGYKKVKRGERYHMVPDKVQAKIVNWIADQIIAGKSQNWIAGELNRKGTPTSRGGKWNRTTIRRILRSPTINGQVVVLDKSNGKPVERVIFWRRWHAIAPRACPR